MTNKLFTTSSFELELAETMSKQLVTSQLENKYSFNKVAKAADYINAAAELLDDTGFATEAKLLTRVIERLASEDSIELSDEELDQILHGKDFSSMSVEEIVSDPLEQTIMVETEPSPLKKMKMYDGSTPLYIDKKRNSVETEDSEYTSLASLVDRLQNKYSSKKKA